MGTIVYAYLEICDGDKWRFAGNLVKEEAYGGELVPENIAPESWGKYNFAVYYEASLEKGLPADLSLTLKQFTNQYWPDQNRPSWMTVAEMREFYNPEENKQFAHLNFEGFAQQFDLPENQIRVVFWADQ